MTSTQPFNMTPRRSSNFIPEHQIYQLLAKVDITTPKHRFIAPKAKDYRLPFAVGTPIVIKGMATELWHKSDNDALVFCQYQPDDTSTTITKMAKAVGKRFNWLGALVTERVNFVSADNAPSEIFVSLQRDSNSGFVISMGFGGILTEEWANQLKRSLLVWPTAVYTPQQALEELEAHWLGQILLGGIRQQCALVSRKTIAEFLHKLWKLEALMEKQNMGLLEVNPFVINQQQEFIALDGVGLYSESVEAAVSVPVKDECFLAPQKIAIAGVSSKPGNVGNLILENLSQSTLRKENLLVVKPGAKQFSGIKCVENVAYLNSCPVDILILALPAKVTLAMIKQLCEQGAGAEVIYIVAGGIGDGADEFGYGEELLELVTYLRKQNKWCPAIVGPNGLGMLLSPLKLNSLFIPQHKLNINFDPQSQVALISQSGAFLITRLSRHSNLSLKYGFSIGNQLDMKLSDFLALIYRDKSIKVVGLYVEGFVGNDVSKIANLVKQFRNENRHVVIYKGGRSILGQTAAAGHTGAMTGDYYIQKRLLSKAGAIIAESFNQFNAVFKWTSAYPDLHTLGKLAIVTNAGYETVGSVDTLGDNDSGRLYKINQGDYQELSKVIRRHQLEGLVAPANPLDLTPMANESMYFDCVKSMIEFGAGIVMLGLVPLSEKLDTEQLNQTEAFAKQLRELAQFSGRLIGVVIDAGVPYQEYKAMFEKHGLPVFDGMDTAVLGTNVLKRNF
jgi:acyl-CoA synthetase (NDP forming)